MSQQLREFVQQSGIELKPANSPNSVSTTASNNALVREIEMDLGITKQQTFPPRLERNLMNNENYGEFAQFVHNSNSNNDDNINYIVDVAQRSPPPVSKNIDFVVSKLNPGMFNATVNKDFDAESRVDLRQILIKTPLPKTPIGEGLYIDTKEVNGIYGRFMTGFTHTREYGKQGDLNQNFFTVQLKITVSNGSESKGATVNFYRNGKIRFSGGFIGKNISNQPELIRRFIVNTYSEKQSFLYNPFEYNNLSGQFRVNGIITNMSVLASKQRIYGFSWLMYNPEESPFMYATYNGHKFIMTKTCNFQVSGASNPSNLIDAYEVGIELARMLYEGGDITLTTPIPNRLTKTQPKKKKTVSKKLKPLTKTQRAALKIDSKQCMRMAKPELVDLAKKLGVVGITASTKKDAICDKIKKISNVKTATFKNTDKNKNVALTGTGNSFKVGRSACTNYSKTELLRVAGILKIKLDPKETKATLCKKIEMVRNSMLAPKPKPKTPPPKPSRKDVKIQKEVVKMQQVIKKRGLNENSIRKDLIKLYGSRWMSRYKNVMPSLENDVKAVKAKINRLQINKINKLGLPFKKNINELKKEMVSNWKRERRQNLETKVIRSQLNVSNVPRNLVTQYRNAATNFIITQGPSMRQLENYKKTWINLRKNR
jgi:hypothetical protein